MEKDIKEEKTLAVDGRTKEQKRKDRDKAELERREKRAALKAALADEIYTNKIEEVTPLPLSGRLKSVDGTIYHFKRKGILTALYLDEFEDQSFLLDSQDLCRFIWQHELNYLTPGGYIKKLFQDATTAETYLKLNGTHCVWSPLTGFWTQLNSELLNNGNIANKADGLPKGFYMAVERDFNFSTLISVIKQRFKLSSSKLAQRLGCDAATILFYENNQRRPSEHFLDKLENLFPEYGHTISTLRKKDGKVLSVEDMTENLIDGVLIVRPFGSQLSATFKNEGILLETEGIEFLYPYREDEMLKLELEKFPDEGFKVIGVLNKVMIEGIADVKELMKSAGELSNKLGIGGIVFSSCLIDGKQEVIPDSDDLQELNYALYDLDDYLDSIKSKQTSGTLAEAMLGVSGAVPDNDNPQKYSDAVE